MSSATDLVHTPPAATPFDILRSAFIELHVTDLEASVRFYAELVGMIISARTDDAVYLRAWEERLHHSLILRQAPEPAVSRIGFRVRREADLEALEQWFGARNLPVRWRAACRCRLPTRCCRSPDGLDIASNVRTRRSSAS